MRRKLVSLALLLFSLSVLVIRQPWVGAVPVFSEDFSIGNFSGWSRTFASVGSSQSVNGGVARFIVPPPAAGTFTYSYIAKDGFTSTVNSTITAEENILISQVPNGCVEGNGAVFLFYVCDSTDLGGNNGNFGVGIDGSGVWSLWIGGNTIYTYVFQTDGPRPVNNTWYHLALTINNPEAKVTLAVDDLVVVSGTQQQFTDKTHPVSIMVGIGEDWWSNGVGTEEVDVANVRLEISDATTPIVPNPTVQITSNPSVPTINPSTSTPSSTLNSPSATAPTIIPSNSSPEPTDTQAIQPEPFPYWVLLGLTIMVAACAELLFMIRKRNTTPTGRKLKASPN